MNSSLRKGLVGASLLGAVVAGGAASSFAANASTDSTTTSAVTATDSTDTSVPVADPVTPPADTATLPADAPAPRDPSLGGHVANGITETLLTGDDATKATEAALAAVPGATIERVETDAEGDAFEAHIVTADGVHQTVKLAADFSLVTVDDGPGPGGPGGHGDHGPRPTDDGTSGTDSSTSTGGN